MHTIYMYVIHERIGVIVSVTGVCFCTFFLQSEHFAYIPISSAEVAFERSVVK